MWLLSMHSQTLPLRSDFLGGREKGNKAIAWRVQFLPRSPFVPRRLYGGFCNEVRLLSRGKKESFLCSLNKRESQKCLFTRATRWSINMLSYLEKSANEESFVWMGMVAREHLIVRVSSHFGVSIPHILFILKLSYSECRLGKESNEWHPTRALGFLPNLNQSLIILFHF